jgi:hypothetical protein
MRREEIQIDCVKVFASLVFSVGVLTNHIFIMMNMKKEEEEKYNL